MVFHPFYKLAFRPTCHRTHLASRDTHTSRIVVGVQTASSESQVYSERQPFLISDFLAKFTEFMMWTLISYVY